MRVLHTSDWHLGAYLEGFTRLPEQERIICQIADIADSEQVDVVLVAGDVYDGPNPPAAAEKLFFSAMARLSSGGRRVVVIAGNHDNPERLSAAQSILAPMGVHVYGLPGDGGWLPLKLDIGGETAVIAPLPYIGERRLNELLAPSLAVGEGELRRVFSERIKAAYGTLAGGFRDDTVNIAMGHLYMNGGETSPGGERDISLGGALVTDLSALPERVQYVALGHLHRSQRIGRSNAYYSGSILQYSLSEVGYAKAVNLAELSPGQPPLVRKVYLDCLKPIETWTFRSLDAAYEKCTAEAEVGRECFAYIKLDIGRPLYQNETKELRRLKPDCLIEIILGDSETSGQGFAETFDERGVMDEFCNFYKWQRKVEPSNAVVDMFRDILDGAKEG